MCKLLVYFNSTLIRELRVSKACKAAFSRRFFDVLSRSAQTTKTNPESHNFFQLIVCLFTFEFFLGGKNFQLR